MSALEEAKKAWASEYAGLSEEEMAASSGAAIASKRGGVLARYGRQATPASQGASLD